MFSIVGMLMCLGYLILLSDKVYGCWDKSTNWNNAGNGNTVFLDRHRLSCGARGNVINMFKLERSGSNQVRYKFKCCRHTGAECNIRRVNNGFTSDGGKGEVIYLDRQRVFCNKGLLNEFKLNRKTGGGSYRYQYKCCNLKGRLRCQNSSTRWTAEGDRTSFYLDRQTVACSGERFLQSFQLKRNNGRLRYDIRCCRVTH
ncbi:uncharacterized protein [Mytilus edulis]|uniref:Uncharacterized protein n=1 Tax=Mytilus galloprovincialis TaxID=29158 RepID=A0A8B6EGE7_MYTGA|nr:Hypothetical predicted protein [Mytilus galloprovincialis]